MDLDERWWIDLLLGENTPGVRSVPMGLVLQPAADVRPS